MYLFFIAQFSAQVRRCHTDPSPHAPTPYPNIIYSSALAVHPSFHTHIHIHTQPTPTAPNAASSGSRKAHITEQGKRFERKSYTFLHYETAVTSLVPIEACACIHFAIETGTSSFRFPHEPSQLHQEKVPPTCHFRPRNRENIWRVSHGV
ncbi:hypothetical protein P280DRAFT_334895 [Massarina eburnea CBS 473.64]|uniref:Uncharacterized protein n=1 Tax=Massarina eburnea CBS 473.64 TaxID=1395130 RepID=A0A6A6RFJ1_9PLEO|nr:hypothetical protein P280DRAFT_334895 [Massarina eburnea CBS 473.64]